MHYTFAFLQFASYKFLKKIICKVSNKPIQIIWTELFQIPELSSLRYP